MPEKYSVGMYGGKFMPLHKGHGYCIDFAAHECRTVYAILFYGGADEEIICRRFGYKWLSPEEDSMQYIAVKKGIRTISAVPTLKQYTGWLT